MTLSEILDLKQKNFPEKYLVGLNSALSIFPVANNGKSDLAYLYEHNISEVVVVDPSPKIEELEKLFPGSWRFHKQHPGVFCSHPDNATKKFDVVIIDGSSNTLDVVWEFLIPNVVRLCKSKLIIKITQDYLSDFDLQVSQGSISIFVKMRYYINLDVSSVELVKRTSRENGTYWVIIDCKEVYSKKNNGFFGDYDINANFIQDYDNSQIIQSTDLKGKLGCVNEPSCNEIINNVRTAIVNHERTGVYRFYSKQTYQSLPVNRIRRGDYTAAIFELSKYDTYDLVLEAAKHTTSKKGRVNRELNKAQKLGYYVSKFDRRTYVPDIYEINCSKTERGGRKMRGEYRRSIQELGGYPDRYYDYCWPNCLVHCSIMYGVFRREIGRCIGDVRFDNRLVGYVNLYRSGNMARYSQILGHGDYLNQGIVYLLHFEIIKDIFINKNYFPGLDYIMYSGYYSRGFESGLQTWKQRCLFEPKYIIYDEVPDWRAYPGMTYI